MDTGIFDNDRFFDASVECFKDSPLNTFINITVETIKMLPKLFFRITWRSEDSEKPMMRYAEDLSDAKIGAMVISTDSVGDDVPAMTLFCKTSDSSALLFCDNETDMSHFEGRFICRSLYKRSPTSNYRKNGIDKYVTGRYYSPVNPAQEGSKSSVIVLMEMQPRCKRTLKLRLLPTMCTKNAEAFRLLRRSAPKKEDGGRHFLCLDLPDYMDGDSRDIHRQAYAGMLLSKMIYIYNVAEWLEEGPDSRRTEGAKNRECLHFNTQYIISASDGVQHGMLHCTMSSSLLFIRSLQRVKSCCCLDRTMSAQTDSFLRMNGTSKIATHLLQAWSMHKVFCIERELHGV